MKKNSFTHSAFFNRRILLGFSLLLGLGGVALALFAFGAGPKPISSTARAGGAGPFFKSLGEPPQQSAPSASAAVAYRGPHNDTRPVHPIRTIPLRQMKAIPPALAPARFEWNLLVRNHLQTQARLGAPGKLTRDLRFPRPPRRVSFSTE